MWSPIVALSDHTLVRHRHRHQPPVVTSYLLSFSIVAYSPSSYLFLTSPSILITFYTYYGLLRTTTYYGLLQITCFTLAYFIPRDPVLDFIYSPPSMDPHPFLFGSLLGGQQTSSFVNISDLWIPTSLTLKSAVVALTASVEESNND
jgi:hypothetical protein